MNRIGYAHFLSILQIMVKSMIDNIYQTFDNNEVYKSIEEKAANFLSLLVKNHVFIDGNKRIAATLFIYFFNYYDII